MTSKKIARQHRTYKIQASGYSYNQIKDGTRSFIVTSDDKEEGFQIGDLLIIYKFYNGKRLEEFATRTIKAIQKSGKGLMRGFIILGLE